MTSRFARPLRHASFRRVWAGQAVSSIGDGIFTVALIGLILDKHPAADVGYVLAAEGLAMVAMSLYGGVLADRIRRSRAMVVADLCRIVGVLGFALGAADGPLVFALLFAAMMGAGSAGFQPAFGALVPSLVPDDELAAANALRTTTTRAAAVIGPAVGGLLLAVSTPRVALLVDIATFVISTLTLIGIKDTAPERAEAESVFREARAGLSAVRSRPWVLTIILQGTAQLLFVMGPAVVLLPIILKSRGDFSAYGVLVSVEAVGAVIGGLVAASWRPSRPGAAAVCALSLLGLQLICLALDMPLYLLGVAVALTGFGYSVFGVLWMSALQRAIPDELLGRVLSVEMLGTFALAPLGLALAPLALQVLGRQPVLIGALAVLVITTIIPLLQRDVRTLGGTGEQSPVPVKVTESALTPEET